VVQGPFVGVFCLGQAIALKVECNWLPSAQPVCLAFKLAQGGQVVVMVGPPTLNNLLIGWVAETAHVAQEQLWHRCLLILLVWIVSAA